jgi:hypothetical protein
MEDVGGGFSTSKARGVGLHTDSASAVWGWQDVMQQLEVDVLG